MEGLRLEIQRVRGSETPFTTMQLLGRSLKVGIYCGAIFGLLGGGATDPDCYRNLF
jgi:hypothetical protein